MSSLAGIKKVRQAIERGGWVEGIDIAGLEGLRLNVRGLGNSDYNRHYAELSAELPAEKKDADGLPVASERERILLECLKETVLIGWGGIDDPFTPEAVAEAFADPDLGPAFRAAVMYAASQVAKRAREEQDAAAKN